MYVRCRIKVHSYTRLLFVMDWCATMKELVKNTVRYVSFDEPLLELVVQAVLLELFDADVPPAAPARSAPL